MEPIHERLQFRKRGGEKKTKLTQPHLGAIWGRDRNISALNGICFCLVVLPHDFDQQVDNSGSNYEADRDQCLACPCANVARPMPSVFSQFGDVWGSRALFELTGEDVEKQQQLTL